VEIKNGFVGRKNCFVATAKRNKVTKTSIISIVPGPASAVHWPIPDADVPAESGAPGQNQAEGQPTPKKRSLRGPAPSHRAQPLSGDARWVRLSTRDNVVGSSSIDAGSKGPGRKPGRPAVETLARTDGFPELRIDGAVPLKADGVGICGAMSQQHGDGGHGNVSAPQKFVHLVGCRDPNARAGPWVRPRPAPPKR